MSQLTLDLAPLVDVPRVSGETLDERFARWLDLNRWVLAAFIALADTALADGATRLGGKHLIEILRWQHRAATKGDSWRLNNDWTSRIVRAAIERRPDLAPYFELRELRS